MSSTGFECGGVRFFVYYYQVPILEGLGGFEGVSVQWVALWFVFVCVCVCVSASFELQ